MDNPLLDEILIQEVSILRKQHVFLFVLRENGARHIKTNTHMKKSLLKDKFSRRFLYEICVVKDSSCEFFVYP